MTAAITVSVKLTVGGPPDQVRGRLSGADGMPAAASSFVGARGPSYRLCFMLRVGQACIMRVSVKVRHSVPPETPIRRGHVPGGRNCRRPLRGRRDASRYVFARRGQRPLLQALFHVAGWGKPVSVNYTVGGPSGADPMVGSATAGGRGRRPLLQALFHVAGWGQACTMRVSVKRPVGGPSGADRMVGSATAGRRGERPLLQLLFHVAGWGKPASCGLA